MKGPMDLLVHLDRWPPDTPKAGQLRARVVSFRKALVDGEQVEEPVYGRDLLASVGVVKVTTAETLIRRMLSSKGIGRIEIIADPLTEPKKTLNDKRVATPRDNMGWRSSGR